MTDSTQQALDTVIADISKLMSDGRERTRADICNRLPGIAQPEMSSALYLMARRGLIVSDGSNTCAVIYVAASAEAAE